MELYYKSLADAKLTELGSSTEQYSSKDFEDWVESVDILSLDDEAVNFPAADAIVTGFRHYCHTVGKKLSHRFKYKNVELPGELKNIGSCWDGSKVGKVNEIDSLYVMDDTCPFSIEPAAKRGFYKVFIQSGENKLEVKPRELREQFAELYDQLISQEKLTSRLSHGGYNFTEESAYSGIRYNGPASTSQFLTTEKETTDKKLLTWDVTPCIKFKYRKNEDTEIEARDETPCTEFVDSKIEADVRNSIYPIEIQNPKKLFPNTSVLLIPSPLEDLWIVSTAHIEAELLRCLSDEAPVKKALVLCKILCRLMKEWNNKEGTKSTSQGIAREVIKLLSNKQNKNVKKIMRFAHIWLPSNERAGYQEDPKSEISVNTAAIKHIIISKACKMPKEKAAFGPKPNEDLFLKLARVVFKRLGNTQKIESEHAFLSKTKISHFSVLPNNASDKANLARKVCDQCGVLLSRAMTEVGIRLLPSHPPPPPPAWRALLGGFLWLNACMCIDGSRN